MRRAIKEIRATKAIKDFRELMVLTVRKAFRGSKDFKGVKVIRVSKVYRAHKVIRVFKA